MKIMKKKVCEKIYKAKNDIKRIWIERKESENNTVFKVGTKYSYIIDTNKKTVKIIPYDKDIKTKGTVSKRRNGEVSIIDICNKTIKELFKDFKQYKINIFKDEIIIEGYDEKQEKLVKNAKKILSFKSKKEASKKIIKIPINQLDCLLKASGFENQINTEYTYLSEGFCETDKPLITRSKYFERHRPILTKTIKLLSLFSGIGAFEEALNNIGQQFNLINYCEKEPFISKSYSLIHKVPESKNLGDVTKIDETKLKDFDLLTMGFPCQDLSSLGNQKGFFDENGNKTRSGLIFDGLRIMKFKKPKVAIIENVRDILYKKNEKIFEFIKKIIINMGYNFYYTKLNSKDFGIPHSRNRFYGVCIRKDIDNKKFKFPKKELLTTTASDYYDDINTISQDYYVGPKQYHYFNEQRLKKKYSSLNSDIIICMSTKQGKKSSPQNFVHDEKGYRILTPREMLALQGFKKEYADTLLKNNITSAQIGYMCGNSITVSVLEKVFKKLRECLPNVFGKYGII